MEISNMFDEINVDLKKLNNKGIKDMITIIRNKRYDYNNKKTK